MIHNRHRGDSTTEAPHDSPPTRRDSDLADDKLRSSKTMHFVQLLQTKASLAAVILCCLILLVSNSSKYINLRHWKTKQYKGQIFERLKEITTDSVPGSFKAVAQAVKTNKDSTTFVHLHIPKTGGQRFYSLFFPMWKVPMRVNCGASSTCCVEGESDEVLSRIAKSPADTCSGNFFSYEMEYSIIEQHLSEEIRDGRVKVLLMLREPQSLFRSQIYHMINHGHCDKHEKRFKPCAQGWARRHGGDIQARHLDLAPGSAAADLPQALGVLREKIYWFGFTEYYEESLCVLAYQLGTFDPKACSCSDGSDSTGSHLRKFNARVSELHPNALFEDGFSVEDVTRKDQQLYEYAFQLFLEKVDAIEQDTGVRVLCNHTDKKGLH
uniref:Sulfotransferase domain-containing protein n=1 Tax=Heterosigma akashiwo TaxID=2829 RepID=A0A7S3XLY1_HETAK